MEDPRFQWLRDEMARQRKTSVALAAHLGMDPGNLSKCIRQEPAAKGAKPRRVSEDEWELIYEFLGRFPPDETMPHKGKAGGIRRAPVRGVVMERLWRESDYVPEHRMVPAIVDSEYPVEIQYALPVADDPGMSRDALSEHVLCIEIKDMHRPIQVGDLLHCEVTDGSKWKTVLRRVSMITDKATYVTKRDGSGVRESLDDYTVMGFVVGRYERFA